LYEIRAALRDFPPQPPKALSRAEALAFEDGEPSSFHLSESPLEIAAPRDIVGGSV
jgi:hypothetical protein